ncbi:hypothetical protein NIES4073_15690 [Kalymmatonema gypsitolerans NIES-4073]|nr:hypothetical protein NIES4073_15690 [Scytonema sp. NIES-4073]
MVEANISFAGTRRNDRGNPTRTRLDTASDRGFTGQVSPGCSTVYGLVGAVKLETAMEYDSCCLGKWNNLMCAVMR